MKEIYALGIGHATPVFIELAETCGYRIVGLYHYNDSRNGEMDHGYKIFGSFNDLYHDDIKGKSFMLTMGDMNIKKAVSIKLLQKGAILPTIIHPTANISRFANISECGVLINSLCEIGPDSIISDGCVLWPRATVSHDCHVSNYVFIGPNAYIGAYTKLGEAAFIGQCSMLVSDKVKIVGNNALIGAGSLVTKPVPDNTIVAGHPAKELRHR